MGRLLSWLLICCMALELLLVGACTNGGEGQLQGNPEDKPAENATSAEITSPVTPIVPDEPLPPASVPSSPEQETQASSQTIPDMNLTNGDSLDATTIITRQASQMTLKLEDMGPGWGQGSAIAPAIQQVYSSSHVYYTQGSSYAPGIQNSVAVYRSISAAESAYAKEKQANLSVSSPAIGNECLLNDSVPINKVLIFRKNNVVVWLWLKQYKEGDIERYARIVEQRITAYVPPPISAEQTSQTVSSPPQQNPVEPPAGIQPVITKSMDGLVTKQAYEMVLSKEDMGPGWIKGNVSPPADRKSISSSHVYYTQGSSFAPAVQNSVSVYRDAETAAEVYADAKPSGASVLNPDIGDECSLNNSVSIDRLLVFRKANVVVWLWLKQYKTGDIESYARILEKKVTF